MEMGPKHNYLSLKAIRLEIYAKFHNSLMQQAVPIFILSTHPLDALNIKFLSTINIIKFKDHVLSLWFCFFTYALVKQIPHYPPPGPIRGFDKGINERSFLQSGAFDMFPFDLYWLKASL